MCSGPHDRLPEATPRVITGALDRSGFLKLAGLRPLGVALLGLVGPQRGARVAVRLGLAVVSGRTRLVELVATYVSCTRPILQRKSIARDATFLRRHPRYAQRGG